MRLSSLRDDNVALCLVKKVSSTQPCRAFGLNWLIFVYRLWFLPPSTIRDLSGIFSN